MTTAFVFPGQGSQSLQMMAPYQGMSIIRQTFDEASAAIGQDLWELVASGPVEALNQTMNTQPVMLTADIAIFRAWCDLGGKGPDWVAGHSLGEYAALVASGVLAFNDAVKAVRQRADLMTQAMPVGGAMAAVLGLDQEKLQQVCDKAAEGQIVEMVNFNAPGQIVVAGHADAVKRLELLAKEAGAKRVAFLPVSGPFHSSLMKGAADKMAGYLKTVTFHVPSIPIIQNVDAKAHEDLETIRDLMAQQICSPVQWIDTIRYLAQAEVNMVIECGPGKVLTGLGKRIAPELTHTTLTNQETMTQLVNGGTA